MSRIATLFCWCLVLSCYSLAATSGPARVSHLEGIAAVAQQGDIDWFEIPVNMPVRSLDRIVLQDESVLEIELTASNVIRLGPLTDLVFDELGDNRLEISLTAGDLILRVANPPYPVVAFPSGRVKIRESGVYRVGYRPGGKVRVTVRKGSAEAVTETAFRVVTVGQVIEIAGPEDGLRGVSRIDLKDDLDFWSDRRDAGRLKSATLSYVGAGYAGAYDLDRHGEWGHEEEYGWVWSPAVGPGWSPYEHGEWAYYPSWGWTWLSYEPWGWLPYHYGRWVSIGFGSRWGWVPYGMGRWAPALVFFEFRDERLHWWPCLPGEDPVAGQRSGGYRRERRPGAVSIPVSDLAHRLRVRAERRSLVTEVPLPGTTRLLSPVQRNRTRSEFLGERGAPVVEITRPGSVQPSPQTRQGPRILTIPADSSAALSASYPDRSRVDRLPVSAARPYWSGGRAVGSRAAPAQTGRGRTWSTPTRPAVRSGGDPVGSRGSGSVAREGPKTESGSSPAVAPPAGRSSPRVGPRRENGAGSPAIRSAPGRGSSSGSGSRLGGRLDR
jgi:hypothetical protein